MTKYYINVNLFRKATVMFVSTEWAEKALLLWNHSSDHLSLIFLEHFNI